jgi:hypothetical protein
VKSFDESHRARSSRSAEAPHHDLFANENYSYMIG